MSIDENKFVRLITVFDELNRASIKGLLEDSDIPYIEHASDNNGIMDFIYGGSISGKDILVPDFLLEKSREILKMVLNIDFSTYEKQNENNK
ncbi:MAG: hypothetical protein ACTHWZ_09155 [Peptoniphilaceae bacterium]